MGSAVSDLIGEVDELFSNKDKELALWAEKYNALNSELTSFKAHENQKIIDLEKENGKLQENNNRLMSQVKDNQDKFD